MINCELGIFEFIKEHSLLKHRHAIYKLRGQRRSIVYCASQVTCFVMKPEWSAFKLDRWVSPRQMDSLLSGLLDRHVLPARSIKDMLRPNVSVHLGCTETHFLAPIHSARFISQDVKILQIQSINIPSEFQVQVIKQSNNQGG